MNINEEKAFLKKIQKDPEALKEFYELYYDKIYRYILKRTLNVQVAEDITSDVFFKVLKNIWKFQFRSISLSSWVYKIATHEICNYFNKKNFSFFSLDSLLDQKKFEPYHEETPKSELMEAQAIVEDQEDFCLIQEKLKLLPQKYQTVIVLRYFENKKIKEIGEIIGKNDSTVKTMLSRAIKRLKSLCVTEKNFETFLGNRGYSNRESKLID